MDFKAFFFIKKVYLKAPKSSYEWSCQPLILTNFDRIYKLFPSKKYTLELLRAATSWLACLGTLPNLGQVVGEFLLGWRG
jgi:hypothetical protein